jgi:capsid assembly protease
MKLLDLLTSPWAVLPAQLLEIQRIYATHLQGEKIDIEAIEARLGRPLASEQQEYSLREGGVAVLTLSGVMAPKANLFMRISGGISTRMAAEQVRSMRADPRVRSGILALETPGGSVFGVPALAEELRALAAEKPLVTVCEGTMASAGYWVGSAANAVYIDGTTDMVGSIGVVATHDYEPRTGRVTTEITAGRYKRMASSDKPLTEEGREYLQQQVDHLYAVFVDAVANNRGVSSEEVLDRMADGRVFIGQQAINAGLVDGVSTVDAMVEQLATNPAAFASRRKAVFALGGLPPVSASAGAAPRNDHTPTEKGNVMAQPDNTQVSRESLERDHPAVFAQLRTEFRAEGAATETARVKAVLAEGEGMKGHSALVMRLAVDGRTTGAEAAQAILAAERSALAGARTAHENDAPAAAPAAPAPAQEQAKTRDQLAADARAYAAKNNVSFAQACVQLGITL